MKLAVKPEESYLDAACLDGECGCMPGECIVADRDADERRQRELEAEAKLNGGLSPLGERLAEMILVERQCPLCGQYWWCCGETMCPQPREPK